METSVRRIVTKKIFLHSNSDFETTDINVLVPGIEDAVDDLRTFRDDKQKELDEFESYYSPNSKSMPSENIVMPVADPVNN